ncbi:MAG TPA: hypothetical protein VN905_04230 [Candidatus Binatia bacterium]|nr:hypothetical protein [Candidatus Binatia bacterium]
MIVRVSAVVAFAFVTIIVPLLARADEAGYLYSYGLYTNRYDDYIVSVDANKPLGKTAPIRPFVDLYEYRDSRTEPGPNFPLILSDNYLLQAAGVQWTTPGGLRVFVQSGWTETFGPVAALPSGGDVRGGVQYYREWGANFARDRGYGNLYASTTYFSRYSDWIEYSQLELGRNEFSTKNPVQPFVRLVLSLDSHGFYWSNLTEAAAGVRFHPFGQRGPSFSLDGVFGVYLRGIPLPAGTKATYWDFRPTLTYGANI